MKSKAMGGNNESGPTRPIYAVNHLEVDHASSPFDQTNNLYPAARWAHMGDHVQDPISNTYPFSAYHSVTSGNMDNKAKGKGHM